MRRGVALIGWCFALVFFGALSASAVRAEILLSTDFSDDGGFSVNNVGAVEKPWTYNGSSFWSVGGSENLASPTSSSLVSAELTATSGGPATLTFSHRYSFERDSVVWDGGQVLVSINGGAFTTVNGFSTGGYNAVVEGNNALNGKSAFSGDSPGYVDGTFITSVADLGVLSAGDTISVEFLGAWDEFARGKDPNWVIDNVSVTAVPEPGALVLGLIGAAGLFVLRRR